MAYDENFLRRTYGAGQADAQSREYNALRIDAAKQNMALDEQRFDQEQQLANTRKLLSGVQHIGENPGALPMVLDDLGKSGIIDPGQIPAMMNEAQTNPQVFQQKLKDFEAQLQYSLGPQDLSKGDLVPVQGDEGAVYTTANEALGRQPVSNTSSGSRQQWEYEKVVADAKAAGQTPPTYREWLKTDPRRQTSADLQAYNQYVMDARRAGEAPVSEQEYASMRAGNLAGSKVTGAGQAQRQLDLPTAYATYDQATQNFSRLDAAVNKLANDDALWKAVGLAKSIAVIPGQEGADIRAAIQNIKSQVGFMVLQDMRNASKTGGALGQVSEKENELLQDNLASLSTSQSPQKFQENLGVIRDYLAKAQYRLDNAWRLTYPELDNRGQPMGDATETTATGPNGEKVVLRNGQWVPYGQ